MARSYALGGMIGLVALMAAGAQAQTDLNAGMSAPQLFAANCAACHRSPQGLSRGRDPSTLAYFLRDHYTTRPAIAAAIAGYLASVRGPARPAAGQPTPGSEQTGSGTPAARTRPLERLANTTVERLKSFAADADAAKPSVPDAPERGIARLLSYSSSGVAVDSLREGAAAAPARPMRPVVPERALSPAPSIAPLSDDQPAKKDAGVPASAAAPPAHASGPVLPLRGPPPSNAMPTTQSNEDKL